MRRAPLGLVLLLFAAVTTLADDTVLQVLVGSTPDSRLEEVLYLASGIELTRAGLTTRRSGDLRVGEAGTPDIRAIEREARRLDVAYVLLVVYDGRGTSVVVDFSLYDTSSPDPLATEAIETPIDIDLDARISRAVRSLVVEAGVERERTASTSLEGIRLAPSTADGGRTVPVSYVRGPEVSVLTSGIIVVGAATEYFRYGVSGGLSGSYAPPRERLGLSVGARSAFIHLFSGEGVQGGQLYVVTAGPELALGTVLRAPARLSARVAGGAAIVMINRERETLAKTDLYMESGVGARLPLGRLLSVGLEVNFVVVFENELPIMGLSPSITVNMEP